jgi:hypothetical protein
MDAWTPAAPRLALVALAATALLACGGKSKGADDPSKLGDSPGALTIPEVDESLCDTSGKRVETYDLNRDGRPDVWKLFASLDEGGTAVEALTCKQVDFDHDGVKDYVVTYRETGEMRSEEIDLTFDDRFDSRHHFDEKSSRVHLIERDTDFDKKPDVWEKFTEDGKLESVRRDSNGDGKPDIWEQYVNGELVAILYDDDFDNRVDRKEQLPATKKPASAEPPPTTPPATEGTGEETVEGPEGDDGAADDAGTAAGEKPGQGGD